MNLLRHILSNNIKFYQSCVQLYQDLANKRTTPLVVGHKLKPLNHLQVMVNIFQYPVGTQCLYKNIPAWRSSTQYLHRESFKVRLQKCYCGTASPSSRRRPAVKPPTEFVFRRIGDLYTCFAQHLLVCPHRRSKAAAHLIL